LECPFLGLEQTPIWNDGMSAHSHNRALPCSGRAASTGAMSELWPRIWRLVRISPPVPDVIFNYRIRTAGNRPGGIVAPDGLRHAPLDIEDGGAGQSTLRQAEPASMQS
jgi:hypothetical protein